MLISTTGEQECKRENGETPSPLRRIILRLGRITPWLAAAHRPSCRHGEGRAHGGENYPWHLRRLFVYHLEHRMSAPSCNGECEGGFPQCTFISKWILAQKLRIPKVQFAKHMKLKKKEDQNVDNLFLLRMGNKMPMEGVTETKFGAETEQRTI